VAPLVETAAVSLAGFAIIRCSDLYIRGSVCEHTLDILACVLRQCWLIIVRRAPRQLSATPGHGVSYAAAVPLKLVSHSVWVLAAIEGVSRNAPQKSVDSIQNTGTSNVLLAAPVISVEFH
jgi:hypothetical protein